MLRLSPEKQKQAIFLRDRALEMVRRQGSTLQMPDYGISFECARPSFRILYYDPENLDPGTIGYDFHYHHLDIYADECGKVFSARWKNDAALEVITFKRGPWEQVFLS
jgi:hypothetical protein